MNKIICPRCGEYEFPDEKENECPKCGFKLNRHKCPVCGEYEFGAINSYDVCDVCGWEDDAIQEENPDEDCCANEMSLNEARKVWARGEKVI